MQKENRINVSKGSTNLKQRYRKLMQIRSESAMSDFSKLVKRLTFQGKFDLILEWSSKALAFGWCCRNTLILNRL